MNIAIVELSESHEECIYSQVSFLIDSGYKVSIFINPKININSYKNLIDNVFEYDFDSISKINQYSLQFKIVKQLKTFDKVIFNTASSSKNIRNIVLFMKVFKTECIGIIHNVEKINKSFTQKIISYKIKKYLALSDHLVKNITLNNKTLILDSFYPIFFPSLKKEKNIKKPDNTIWICIPGRVYLERRNYHFILEHTKVYKIPENIKFVILGNINTKDGQDFKTEIKKQNLLDNFIFFETFITNNSYYSYLKESNYIMPLLQKNNRAYLTSKITGAFNLAFSFKKHLLCHEFYQLPDLKRNSIFYNDSNFDILLNRISKNLEEKTNTYSDKKWDYEYQKNKYITFINK